MFVCLFVMVRPPWTPPQSSFSLPPPAFPLTSQVFLFCVLLKSFLFCNREFVCHLSSSRPPPTSAPPAHPRLPRPRHLASPNPTWSTHDPSTSATTWRKTTWSRQVVWCPRPPRAKDLGDIEPQATPAPSCSWWRACPCDRLSVGQPDSAHLLQEQDLNLPLLSLPGEVWSFHYRSLEIP